MNNDRQTNTPVRAGASFTQLLTIAFIVLKLCGVITWSWLWVLSPLILDIVVIILVIAIAVPLAMFSDKF